MYKDDWVDDFIEHHKDSGEWTPEQLEDIAEILWEKQAEEILECTGA